MVSKLMEDWRPENSEEAVLFTCSTFISVINNKGSRIVQFSHFSIKEFLTSDRLRTSGVENIRHYHVPLDDAHTLLARASLTVLLQLDEKVDKQRLKTFPLVFYAAQHWVKHAQYKDVASRVQGAMEKLFNPKKPYFSTWIWIHNLTRRPIDNLTQHPPPPKRGALHHALLCGFHEVANHLINTHAEDINAQSGYPGASLHVASKHGNAGFAYRLLQHKADVNVRSKVFNNWTPLHFASLSGHAEVVQLLLEHGADVNAQSKRHEKGGRTPLEIAKEEGHEGVAQLLLEHGAKKRSTFVANILPKKILPFVPFGLS
jgi:Ankyrin repeats (3 copies)